MDIETVLAEIELEFSAARDALGIQNEGRARVCARRAAGKAVALFLSGSPHPAWGTDAMSMLRALSADSAFPDPVRTAALRLTTKIDPQFAYPSPAVAVEDARIIVNYLLNLPGHTDAR